MNDKETTHGILIIMGHEKQGKSYRSGDIFATYFTSNMGIARLNNLLSKDSGFMICI